MMQRMDGGKQLASGNTRSASFRIVVWLCGIAAGCVSVPATAQLVPQEAYTAKKAAQQAVRATNASVAAGDAAVEQNSNRPAAVTVPVPDASKPQIFNSGSSGKSAEVRGKRDPFASIIHAQSDGGSGCSNGKRCLEVQQIILKGVVKSPEGMVAMVENQRQRSYFLHERDPIFNGEVIRITKDSIVFRENVIDKLGHVKVREVVKRLGVAGPAA